MLSRETYKWLQSLDLKVKNPKRDLANGVVIAEIFSRYFPNQLNIDLFYSGSGTEQKQNNWLQLQKCEITTAEGVFKKNEIHIPQEAVTAVMTCQPDAAILFIENIHRLLTNRRFFDYRRRRCIHTAVGGAFPLTTPPKAVFFFFTYRLHRRAYPTSHQVPHDIFDTSIPHFALPTAANIIRNSLAPPDKADTVIREYKARFKTRVQETSPKIVKTGKLLDQDSSSLAVQVNTIEIAQRN